MGYFRFFYTDRTFLRLVPYPMHKKNSQKISFYEKSKISQWTNWGFNGFCFKNPKEIVSYAQRNRVFLTNPYIFATQYHTPLIFQNMNSVTSNNLRLKYWSFTTSGCKHKEIRKFKFVSKTQFLWNAKNPPPPQKKTF